MKNKISVIVPVYNVEKYLRKCVESIKKQTYSNLEIILVDDGSTDSSGKICDELNKEDKRIKVVHKKNGGLSSARNAGVAVCTGDYVGFVDSDDEIDENMYNDLLNSQIDNFSAICMCRMKYVYDAETKKLNEVNLKSCSGKELKQLILIQETKNNEHEVMCEGMAWSVCRCLFRKELLNNIQFQDVISEDLFFLLDYIKDDQIISVIDKYYYLYYQRDGSISKTYNKKTIEKKVKFLSLFDRYMNKYKNIPNQDSFNYWYYFSIVRDVSLSNELKYKDIANIECINSLNTKNNYKALMKCDIKPIKKIMYFLCRYKLFFILKLLYKIFK